MVVFKDFIIKNFNVAQVDLFSDTDTIAENYIEIIGSNIINPESKTEYDVAIMLDTAKTEKLGKYEKLFSSAKTKINIDHHNTNELPGDINIVEQVSSTCELVYKICKACEFHLPTEDCGKLYAGIITDTNNLTVGNFTSETFSIISEFINDINHEAIYIHFFGNNTLLNMKLLAKAINNIKSFENGEIILTHLSKEELSNLGATHYDLVGIVNRIATINTCKLVCFIYPHENNELYVSMRARKGYSVAEVAKKYGGGGHLGAAAFNSTDNIENIENVILEEFVNILNSTPMKPSNLF